MAQGIAIVIAAVLIAGALFLQIEAKQSEPKQSDEQKMPRYQIAAPVVAKEGVPWVWRLDVQTGAVDICAQFVDGSGKYGCR
jgi:hypothetical protein